MWPPPEHEAEFEAMKAKADAEERKGMLWAVCIVVGFWGGIALWIHYAL